LVQYAEVGACRMAYHRHGAGETVLLVHGITTYSFIWRNITPLLSGYDVIAVDLIGCGDSDKPLDLSYAIKDHAAYLKRFVDQLGVKQFHFARCLDNHNLMAIEAELRQLRLPVLIVRGDADAFLPPAIAEKLHDEIPHNRLQRIATAGHFIQVDEPEWLAEQILTILSQAAAGSQRHAYAA